MSKHLILCFDFEDDMHEFAYFVDNEDGVLIKIDDSIKFIKANYIEHKDCNCKPLVGDY